MSEAVQAHQPVAIRAELSVVDPDSCKFTISRALSPGGERFFESREQAGGSPLVERLFELTGIVRVLVAENVLVVEKAPEVSWAELKPGIAGVVRNQLQTGMPPVLEAPAATGSGLRTDREIYDRVQDLLDREVNPSVAAHQGALTLVAVRDRCLYVEMRGRCQGCAGSQLTLRQGFERMVRRVVPEITGIVDVTNHAAGATPFYRPS